MEFDETDTKILKNLLVDARLSARQLAYKLGLSTVTVLTRIKKLEQKKIITGYAARLDHQILGYDLVAIIEIKTTKGKVLKNREGSLIPAVTHLDGSARIQTIRRDQNSLYYDVINEFFKMTGVPVLINTSFNRRGEPIVCSPNNALDCFLGTNMDILVMGSCVLDKKDMPARLIDVARKQSFTPD